MKYFFSKIVNKTGFRNKENRPLLNNLFSLGIIQGSNFILPLLTFPYIIKTIGVEKFGLISLLQTIMTYFIILTDYGFNMSATKDISINRNDKANLSKIFSEVIVTKAFLFSVILFCVILFVLFIPKYSVYTNLIFYSLLMVLGQVLQPNWFFQGMERMKYITYINILIKFIYTISIFVFVNKASDYIYVNFLNGISGIVGGVISLLFLYKTFRIRFITPSINQIKNQLVDNWAIFFSSVSITIANNTNILILSLYTNPLVIGYYSIAEKIFNILRTFAVILHQVIYPRVCLLALESFEKLSWFLEKIIKVVLVSFLPLSVIVFLTSEHIIYLITGEYLPEASVVLQILSFAPLVAALNVPAAQTMLAYQLNKVFVKVVSIGAVTNISLNLFLSYLFLARGTAWSILISEMTITGLLYIALYRSYPQYSLIKNTKLNVFNI